MSSSPKLLWKHKDPTSTRIHQFKTHIELKCQVELDDYEKLRKWSITNLNQFWEEVWHFTGIKASKPFTRVPFTTPSKVTIIDRELRP